MRSNMKPTEENLGTPVRHEPAHPWVAYEEHDVDASSVLHAGLFLAVVILATLAVVGAAFHFLSVQREQSLPELSPMLRNAPRELPPEPRLQGIPGHAMSPQEEYQRFLAAEESRLESYGWVDPKEGIAHIPIGEAMKMIEARGLPAVPPAAKAVAVPAPRRGPKPSSRPRASRRSKRK